MTNESDDATIRDLEAQLEAAKAKARIEAMEAELAALKAKDAASAADAAAAEVVVAAPQSVAVAPVAASPVNTPEAKPRGRGGLVAALVVLLVAIVATLGATYLAIRGDLRAPWATPAAAPTDVLLIGAGDVGPAPAVSDPDELTTFEALSQPATGTAPDAVASLTSLSVAGDTPEILGLSIARCEYLDQRAPEDAAGIDAFVASLNADETFEIELTSSEFSAFTQQITYGHLLADTRVTYNGFSSGATFPIQAVLQKGTLVGVDRFGVPRLHCGSGVALTAPVAAGGEVVFSGGAWGDLDLHEIVSITAAAEAQTGFTVLPVGPSNVDTAFEVAPRVCAWARPTSPRWMRRRRRPPRRHPPRRSARTGRPGSPMPTPCRAGW